MILSAIEALPDATDGDFKRNFADEMLIFLREEAKKQPETPQSQPVAWRYRTVDDVPGNGGGGWKGDWKLSDQPIEPTVALMRTEVEPLIPLHASQPYTVPNVCDGKEQDAFEKWAIRERMDMATHPLHWLFLNKKTAAARRGWRGGIEYCRAAMLQSGNSPVVPDVWIPAGEQLPPDSQWCVVNTEYGYYVQCWSNGQGWLGDDVSIPEHDVTHWMPIPAAPQHKWE